MSRLVEINLHGDLGEKINKKYLLEVKSVGEAVHAINCLTENKLYKYLLEKDKEGLKYQVLVNNKVIDIPIEKQEEIIRDYSLCELSMPDSKLQRIDIVPVIEGGDKGIIAVVLGVVLIIVGILVIAFSWGSASVVGVGLITAGIGLVAGGIIYLLSSPPKFEDFRSGKRNYLFSGPDNITGEGGPVPLLYGRLIVGSQVISAYLDSDYSLMDETSKSDDYIQVVEGYIDKDGKFVDGNIIDAYRGLQYTGLAKMSPRQKAVVYDMVSEGPIDGPVSIEYIFTGTVGKVGFDSARTKQNKVENALNGEVSAQPWLRSVIYNEVPALSADGLANFQQITVSYTVGTPDGELLSRNSNKDIKNELRITRPLSERLWYNNPDVVNSTNAKIFRLLNTQLKTIRVTFKIPQFHRVDSKGKFFEGRDLTAVIYYRPIYDIAGDTYARIHQTGASEYPDPTNPPYKTRAVKFDGLITVSPLTWTTNIDLDSPPTSFERRLIGWEIKVERTTPEQTGSNQAPLFLESITEVYQDMYSMPNSAIFRNEFWADYFSQIPKRSYDVRGLKVKVPNNYNTLLRRYSASLTHEDGTAQEWDGGFNPEKKWTDNPAWCFYDLITSKRYGLGKWIPEESVDKWTLYLIAKYCDVMVSDGYGSVEPRFTCNTYIATREQAYKVLNDFASIFNSIVYYGFGGIQVIQDRPKDPVLQFTNANVEEGNFIYSSSSKRTRHTVALIRYNDPKNFFRPTTEYVEDIAGIQRYGFRQLDLTAYGCTSRGQAVRLGRWALLSESLETETVSFTAGIEGAYLRPGDIFKIYDQNKKTSNYAGRITNIAGDGATVTLDRSINTLQNRDYTFSVLTPSYFYDPQVVAANPNMKFLAPKDVTGIRRPQIQKRIFNGTSVTDSNGYSSITLSPPLDGVNYTVEGNPVWLIEGNSPSTDITDIQSFTDSSFDYFRCIKIEEKDTLKYDIVGLQYISGKFPLIENGLNFERSIFEYGAIPVSPQGAFIDNSHGSTRFKIDYSFVVPNTSGVSSFWVYANTTPFTGTGIPEQKYLIDVIPSTERQGYFFPTSTGNYNIRIYSYNEDAGIFSSSFASGSTFLEGLVNPIDSVTVSTLMVDSYTGAYGQDVDIITTDDINPTFTWQLGSSASSSNLGGVQCRLTIREPSSGLIPSSTIYKQATGIINSGRFEYTFDFLQNKNISGGPYRNYSVVVEAHSNGIDQAFTSAGNRFRPFVEEFGWVNRKAGYANILFMNPPVTGITLTSGGYITGNYISTGNIDSIGGVTIKFLSGSLPTGIVGGFIYFNTGVYSANFAKTGNLIQRTEFEFNTSNHISKSFTVPGVVNDYRISSGFISFSAYDSFDKEHKRFNPTFYTGLDITNVVPISREGGYMNLFINNQVQFSDFNRKENMCIVKITGAGNSYDMVLLDSGNNSYRMFSHTGVI